MYKLTFFIIPFLFLLSLFLTIIISLIFFFGILFFFYKNSGKPDKGNKAHDAVTNTEKAVDSLVQEVKVSVRVMCGFELNRVMIHLCTTCAEAIVQFATEMEAREVKLSKGKELQKRRRAMHCVYGSTVD